MNTKMVHKRQKLGVLFFTTVALNVMLLIAAFFLMGYVKDLLYSDIKVNLTEIVTQNKDVITSKILLEVNNLQTTADRIEEQLGETGNDTPEGIKSIFLKVLNQEDGDYFFANKDGVATFLNGKELDISGRQYFKLALQDISNISERTVSRMDGNEIFIISVPIKYNSEIIGAVQRQYTPQEMYKLCSVSLFSEQGVMYIINSQGYILISSSGWDYDLNATNFYRTLFLNNPEQSKQLQKNIQAGQAGFMESENDGKTMFSAYTPIDQVYDWYLISSVETNAVSPNTEVILKLFYFILLMVGLFFTSGMFYYYGLKKKQQQRLEEIAFVDKVTRGDTYTKFIVELPNILMEYKEKQFYVFTFDIDNFKYINSFYGFDAGDEILKRIYDIYIKKLKQNERIARVSGDHFVMLLDDVSEMRISELFLSEVAMGDIQIYLSAGVYPIAEPTERVSLMMDKANIAKQKIKGLRDKWIEFYSEDYDKQLVKDEQIKRAVEQALQDGDVIPFFQPKVDIETGKLMGAEALARWKGKDGRLISPGEFIPVCEQSGLIVNVDITIFEKTLEFISDNLSKGVECVPISVNFSRMHLLNREFLSMVAEKLRLHAVPPELIEIELTETAMFENYQKIGEFITELHNLGLQISMDDFGSGYSSLHMLKDLDIDILKIDRGFLLETANSGKQRTIFEAIVKMAQSLKMTVVVEGVENIENVGLMKEFGCSIAQGFYYARPMEQKKFQVIYEEGKI